MILKKRNSFLKSIARKADKVKKEQLFIAIIILLSLLSCKQQEGSKPLFQLIENSGIEFVNNVQDNDTINILNYRNFYNGGGVPTRAATNFF
jgi:hypothetical protein